MKFAVTVVSPPGYIHSAAFHEVAETLHYGLCALGHDCVITAEGKLPGRRHIVLGWNLLPHFALPLADDAILYNLEQVQAGSDWFRPGFIDILRRFTVWDYCQQNVDAFAAQGIQVGQIVPIGYVSELTRIPPAAQQEIDVLFFGSINPRREAVFERMRADGLAVRTVFGVYGKQRDALIARAKLQLNVHFYEAKLLEVGRITYLLANHCAVLSEYGADPQVDAALAGGVAFAPYDQLAQRARALIELPDERQRLARRGFEIVVGRPVVEYLRAALESAFSESSATAQSKSPTR